MEKAKTVLIIDDHPLFREGLKSIISRSLHYEVIGEAGTAGEGFDLTKKMNPDVILVDISLADKNGIELTREIRAMNSDACVLVISMHSKINYITEAFQAGALGYIVKESTHERLLQGLDTVVAGEYYLDSAISKEVVNSLMDASVREARTSDPEYGRLTPREQEVMRLLAEGFKAREIADMLYISPKTAENHRCNIMQKLRLHSAVELVRYAAKIGLIDVDLWKV